MRSLSQYWWVLSLRGLLGILFGLLALFTPGAAFFSLILAFGSLLAVEGALTLIYGRRDWLVVLEGLLSLAAGVLTWAWPAAAAVGLLFWLASWAIVSGGVELAQAVRLRHYIAHEWMLGLAGLCSIAFGGLVLAYPGAGLLTVTWMMGGYALVFGTLFIALGLRVKRIGTPEAPHSHAPAAR